jgi:transposase-like protein
MHVRTVTDRARSFEPKLVRKHQRRFEGFDERIVALCARDETRDTEAHLRESFASVGHDLVSRATSCLQSTFADPLREARKRRKRRESRKNGPPMDRADGLDERRFRWI